MVLSNIGEEVSDVASDVGTGCLNTSNDLINSGSVSWWSARPETYLRNDIQPCIDLDTTETTGHCMADLIVRTKLEPQSE